MEEVIAPISQPQVRVEEPKEQIKPTLYDKLRVYLLEQLDIRLPERKKQTSAIDKPKSGQCRGAHECTRKWRIPSNNDGGVLTRHRRHLGGSLTLLVD